MKQKIVSFLNVGQITNLLFRVILILAKIWKKKKHFSQFFNEIWLKVGEHEQIYITE